MAMSPRHIYDSEGRWVAFIVDGDMFDCSGDLIARIVNRRDVYSLNGSLLGTIKEDGHFQSLQPAFLSFAELEPFGI